VPTDLPRPASSPPPRSPSSRPVGTRRCASSPPFRRLRPRPKPPATKTRTIRKEKTLMAPTVSPPKSKRGRTTVVTADDTQSAPIAADAVPIGDRIVLIHPKLIVEDQRNPRTPTKNEAAEVAELKASIRDNGQAVPILVQSDGGNF